jgi:hypothetical protein
MSTPRRAGEEPHVVRNATELACVDCALYPGASAYVTSAQCGGPEQMDAHLERHAVTRSWVGALPG